MVKVVVVKIDGRLALAAIPATHDLDTQRLRIAAGAKEAELASEREFLNAFPGCQLGTMPPIGGPFGMDTYMERELAKEQFIAFNAGTHSDVIAMAFNDYRHVAHPKLVHISLIPRESALAMAQI